MLFSLYPYQNFSDYNLDWIIHMIKKLTKELENFVNINTIKYADPIEWDITRQYEANTVVIDGRTGNAYISVNPVPTGVGIENTEYWTSIFNYNDSINDLREQIAAFNENKNKNATKNVSKNELIWLDGILNIALSDIQQGTTYIGNVNVQPLTIEDYIKLAIDNNYNDFSCYANVKKFGAVGDGVTDDSESFQNAINSGKPVFIPSGIYRLKSVTKNGGDVEIIGGIDAVIMPIYTNGIASNIFNFTNCNDVIISKINFNGEKYGVTNYDVLRESAIDCEYCNFLSIKDCNFNIIDDSITDIEKPFRKRKGLAITSHDVNLNVFENCKFSDMGNEECVWITNYNKSMNDIDIRIINCSSERMFGLSLFDCIANNVIIDGFMSDSTDDYKTFSFSNLMCSNVKLSRSYFYGSYGDIIDTSEENLFYCDSIVIDSCEFNGYKSRAINALGAFTSVSNCYDGGACLVFCRNAIASSEQLIEYFGSGCYTVYKPCKLLIIKNCNHDSTLSNPKNNLAFMLNTLYFGGDVIIEGCQINQGGHKGSAIFSNGIETLKVNKCNFKNAGYLAGSSDYKAFIEISTNSKNVILTSNHIDSEGLCGIITSGVKTLIIDNTIIDNLTAYVVRNFIDTYSVHYLKSDSTFVNVYADNYGRNTNASIYDSAWIAERSSVANTELTNEITLPIGLYLLFVKLPYSNVNVLYNMYDKTRNTIIAEDFKSAYGTMAVPYRVSKDNTKISVFSASTTEATFTNISNAGLYAVFIKE